MVYHGASDEVESVASPQWFPNTGASNHATPDPSMLSSSASYTGSDTLRVGNGNGLPILSTGSSAAVIPRRSFCLSEILLVPGLSASLLSVQKFASDNSVFF